MSVDWCLPELHAQLSLERTLAQLQFEDFISVAELTNNRVNGGNGNLLPQRAWAVLVTLDQPLLGDGLVKLELGYTSISLAYWRINFRQDLGKFAWGIDAEASSDSTNYRLDEFDTFRGVQPYASIFAEYRPDKATSIRIGARNRPAARYRTFFTPSRANLAPFAYKVRGRNEHVTPYITVKRSFG